MHQWRKISIVLLVDPNNTWHGRIPMAACPWPHAYPWKNNQQKNHKILRKKDDSSIITYFIFMQKTQYVNNVRFKKKIQTLTLSRRVYPIGIQNLNLLKKAWLQDFLVILKRRLQNYQKIMKFNFHRYYQFIMGPKNRNLVIC